MEQEMAETVETAGTTTGLAQEALAVSAVRPQAVLAGTVGTAETAALLDQVVETEDPEEMVAVR